MAADIGQGSYVGFGTALHTTTGYKITSVQHGGITRAVADATHMNSSAKEFIASAIYDPGELTVEVFHDPSIKPWADLSNVATSQTVTVYWANGGTAVTQWTALGYMSGYEAGAQMEDMMSGTVTIKLSGTLPS